MIKIIGFIAGAIILTWVWKQWQTGIDIFKNSDPEDDSGWLK